MWRRSDKQAIRRCGEMIRQGGLRQQAPPTPHTHFYLSLPLPSYLSDVPWLLSLPPPLLPERGAVALIYPSPLPSYLSEVPWLLSLPPPLLPE